MAREVWTDVVNPNTGRKDLYTATGQKLTNNNNQVPVVNPNTGRKDLYNYDAVGDIEP